MPKKIAQAQIIGRRKQQTKWRSDIYKISLLVLVLSQNFSYVYSLFNASRTIAWPANIHSAITPELWQAQKRKKN
jgi:hypothetical protein